MPPKDSVYAIDTADGFRRIVAAPNHAKAAKLLGVTPYILKTHGRTTERDDEVEIARSDAGAVWGKHDEQGEWTILSPSRKAAAMPQHGGRRENSGPRLKGSGKAISRSLRLTDEAYAVYTERGGAELLRNLLASDLDLNSEEWKMLAELGGVEWLRKQIAKAAKGRRNR